jgi:hypothetical protein
MQPITLPYFWESLLKAYVKKTFYVGTRKESFAGRAEFVEGDYRFFAEGVKELSVSFTEDRHALPKNYFNRKELRSGYLLYFLPVNALKVTALLDQNPLALPKEGPIKLNILDVGSGPGTGMFGVMLHLENFLGQMSSTDAGAPRKLQLSWTLIDQNREALGDAWNFHQPLLQNLKDKLPGWHVDSELRVVSGNLFTEKISQILKPQPFDLVMGLNVINELPRQKRFPLTDVLVKNYLTPTGKLLLMEPALRQTTRDLMMLHDEIAENEAATVFAPCLHQSGCPMLRANDRDWCHTYIPWDRPDWIEKIDRLAGIQKDFLKCSYLFLGKPSPEEKRKTKRPVWRVVSGQLDSKGKSERLLCGEQSLPDLLRIVRLDRDWSATNQGFDDLHRGDIVELPNSPTNSPKVTRDTVVKKV